MKKQLSLAALAVAAICTSGMVSTAQAVLTDFKATDTIGSNGWYSSDTRNSSGVVLNGIVSSHEAGGSAGDDLAIADQITYVAGPAGSLNNEGSVRLWATDNNKGKAHLSVQGDQAASFLLTDDFTTSYRYFNEKRPSATSVNGVSRTLGVSFGVEYNGVTYSFSHVKAGNVEGWNEDTVTADTGEWRLFSSAWGGSFKTGTSPSSVEISQTLLDWSNYIVDTTPSTTVTGGPINIGDVLNNGTLFEVGVNLGTYQSNNNTYVDWFNSTVVNFDDQGKLTVLGAPDSVPTPEPATAGLLALGLFAAAARRRRRA